MEVYEYEQPENFSDDEEIDEDEAFNDGMLSSQKDVASFI